MTQEFAEAQAEVLRIYRDALIEKACEWLEKNVADIWDNPFNPDKIVEQFKQAMKENNMKSYTDIEQSKKLAEILPVESADMYYPNRIDIEYQSALPIEFKVGNPLLSQEIPCWSLAALLEIIPNQFDGFQFLLFPCYNSDDWSCCYENENAGYFDVKTKYITYGGSPVDVCFEMILKLKENNLL